MVENEFFKLSFYFVFQIIKERVLKLKKIDKNRVKLSYKYLYGFWEI